MLHVGPRTTLKWFISLFLLCPHLFGNTTVWTQRYDQFRSGANTTETILTPSTVDAGSFGKLWSYNVDGDIYAQPLYLPNLTIGGANRNVLFVATEGDSVYAFDADRPGPPLWHVTLGSPVPARHVTADVNLLPVVGITGTPVIDTSTHTLYVVAYNESDSFHQAWVLHALDAFTGAEKMGGPVSIAGGSGNVIFDPDAHLQRPGLALVNGVVYILFGSHADLRTWHGWIFAYSATSLKQLASYVSTPNGSAGAFWMSGQAPVVDRANDLFTITGNGTSDDGHGSLNQNDYGEAVLKLSPALQVLDFFFPNNLFTEYRAGGDEDFGSSGAVGINGNSKNFLVAAGKKGTLVVLDQSNLGHENSPDRDEQSFSVGGAMFGAPVFWNDKLYVSAAPQPIRAYSFDGSSFITSPSAQFDYGATTPNSNAAMTVSANGSADGILWASVPLSVSENRKSPGRLYALDASNINTMLWSSDSNPSRDSVGLWAKYTPPTVANGHVYEPTFSQTLDVFGPLSTARAASARFLRTHVSAGNWKASYGMDGYSVVGHAASYPKYAKVSIGGSPWFWDASTSDSRGLQEVGTLTGRVAACTFGSNYSIDINVTDSATHQVALYAVDWDSTVRAEQFQVVDANTGAVLDTEQLRTFHAGAYLSWSIAGHVKINVSVLSGSNAVVSGIFFGDGTASASFASSDRTVQGTWKGTYGFDGYNVLDSAASYPRYAAVSFGGAPYLWASSTSDPRGLQQAASGTPRVAACVFGNSYSIDIDLTDGEGHEVALYAVDWDSTARAEQFQVVDAVTGAVLDTQELSAFHDGAYVVWRIAGHVKINVTSLNASNAVVSGIFFGSGSASATFVTSDWTTQGTWKGVYGLDGYYVVGDQYSYPRYLGDASNQYETALIGGPYPGTLFPGSLPWTDSQTWASSTRDVRAPQRSKGSGRVASCWFSQSYTIDAHFADATSHQIALYMVDWDSGQRKQVIQVVDARTNAVLDTKEVSSFMNGVYLVWNVTGPVRFNILSDSSTANAVISGVFFR